MNLYIKKTAIFFLITLVIFSLLSCSKEFSCEGCIPKNDIDINQLDTAWQFTADGKFYYGFASYALFNPTNNGFFWGGPYKLNIKEDIGIGIRIDPLFFDNNITNLSVKDFGFIYRLNNSNGGYSILLNSFKDGLNGTILNFDNSTNIIKATFSGKIIDMNSSDTIVLTNGKFRLKFK